MGDDDNVIAGSMHFRNKYKIYLGKDKSEKFLRVQPTRCNVSQIYLFLQDVLHVSDGFSVHHQELKTAHTASGI